MSFFKLRKKTTRSSRAPRGYHPVRRGRDTLQVQVHVSSPRIVMIQLMRGLLLSAKITLFLAVIAGILWSGFLGIKHVFIDNPNYQLKEIYLQTNGHLDKNRVIQVTHINTSGSIFEIDAKAVRKSLKSLPEVIECSVKRRLPGKLYIKVTERVPIAWLQCEQLHFPGRSPNGILTDKEGITFPCEKNYWNTSRDLPVIEISQAKSSAFHHGKTMNHPDALRALELINLFNSKEIPNDLMPERVILLNGYSMKAICNDGTQATFGMYEHERQMSNLLKIYHRTQQTHRTISTINLIPKKNIPVRFSDAPVLVQPHSTPKEQSPHDREIQSILNRN